MQKDERQDLPSSGTAFGLANHGIDGIGGFGSEPSDGPVLQEASVRGVQNRAGAEVTEPLVVTRDDRKTVKLAIGIAFIFQAVIGVSVADAAMAVHTMYPYISNPDFASTVMSADVLPPVVGALFIVAILAAIMSTLSGIMIVSASALSHDFYATMSRLGDSDREKRMVNRVAVLILAILPLALTVREFDLVQFIMLLKASLTASFFFAAVVLGLNWKRGTATGAISSMVGGFATAMGWYFADNPFGLDPVVPGVLVSSLLFVAISLATRASPETALAPFFGDRDGRGTNETATQQSVRGGAT